MPVHITATNDLRDRVSRGLPLGLNANRRTSTCCSRTTVVVVVGLL